MQIMSPRWWRRGRRGWSGEGEGEGEGERIWMMERGEAMEKAVRA